MEKMKKVKIAIQGELELIIAVNNLFKGAEIKTARHLKKHLSKLMKMKAIKYYSNRKLLAGRVADIHYLLPKYKLQIHGEYF